MSSSEAVVKLEQELHDEIEQTQRTLEQNDRETFATQDEAYAAARKADASGDEAERREADRLHGTLLNLLSRGTNLTHKLKTLREPAELERRINQKLHTEERIGKMTDAVKANKPAKPTAKSQGFPDVYLSENGNFKPGLDARAKSDLINAALEVDANGALHKFTKERALELLKIREWLPFLERKREILADKAKKAEAKAAEKKTAAEAKAAAKKSTPKATEAGSNEVTPDPKSRTTKKPGRKVGA